MTLPNRFDEFREKQRKFIEAQSKERKEQEKRDRAQIEKEYWADMREQSDEDNNWDREPKEVI